MQRAADLAAIDVEGGHHLDVLGPVAAELEVQEPPCLVARPRQAPVVLDALEQRARAVADARDGDLDAAHAVPSVHSKHCTSIISGSR